MDSWTGALTNSWEGRTASAKPHVLLAIRPGALGDALLAWPALALLRRLGSPAAPPALHLVSRTDVLPLALSSDLAQGASAFDDPRWLGLFSPAVALPQEARDADTVIAWLDDPHGEVANALRAASRGRVLVAPGRPDPTRGEHAALQLLRPLEALGMHLPASITQSALLDLLPPLAAGPEAQNDIDTWCHQQGRLGEASVPIVALHAGSGGAVKRWPAERYGMLAAQLARSGVRPLLVSGPQDATISAQVVAAAQAAGLARLPVAEGLSIPSLAALLRRCALMVGNDSGVAHLAALLRVPVLALFGPTDPAIWSPLGGNVLRAAGGDMARLSLDEVTAVATSILATRFVPRHGSDPRDQTPTQ